MLNRLEKEIDNIGANVAGIGPKTVKKIFFIIRIILTIVIIIAVIIGVHETMGRGNPQSLIIAIVGISALIIGLEMATIIVFGKKEI